jgi:uncharacterized protein YjbI with pentapeptide repeats
VFANHLDPSSLCALASTSQLANARIYEVVMNHPESVLRMLGKCSRQQAAQFFQTHRNWLGTKVINWLEENPDNHAAYTLYLMMCCVRTSMVDLVRLDQAQQYLQEHHFPPRIQESINFVGSFLKAKTATPQQRSDIMKKCLQSEIDFYINLRGANLTQLKLDETNFCGADLRSADMSEGEFRQCNFNVADMYGTEITRAKLQTSSFIGANLRGLIDESDLDNFHHSSLFACEFFRKNELHYTHGKTIFPAEKNLRQAKAKLKRDLDRLNSGPPFTVHALLAITNDFMNTTNGFTDQHKFELLEYGLNHPLFATHHDGTAAFFNKRIMTIYTQPQKEIAARIKDEKCHNQLNLP